MKKRKIIFLISIISAIISVGLFINLFVDAGNRSPYIEDWGFYLKYYGIGGKFYDYIQSISWSSMWNEWYLSFIFSMLFLAIFLVSIIALIVLFVRKRKR